MSGILSIGHRGASGITPENTKLSFLKALDLGADAIEMDVQLTVDEEVVVIHDESLERTTSGEGLVCETDWETISHLDAGSWFSASFSKCEVPTLDEVLKTIGGRALLNIELKPDKPRGELLARHVIDLVETHDLFSSVVFSSFDTDVLESVRRLAPEARIGVLCVPKKLGPAAQAAIKLGAVNLDPHVSMVDARLIEEAHARNWNVWAWTANEPGEIELLAALGVDGVFTDFPDRVVNPRRRRA